MRHRTILAVATLLLGAVLWYVAGVADQSHSLRGLRTGELALRRGGRPTEVAAGMTHTLYVEAGLVFGWGSNEHGELGDGSQTERVRPVHVLDVDDAVAVAAGDGFSVALAADGSVWTWGRNDSGQLGRGANRSMDALAGRVVASGASGDPLGGIIAVAAGTHHVLALASDGAVWSWGSGAAGRLGNGSTSDTPYATQVVQENGEPLARIIAVAAGAEHSVALDASGRVWSWGDDSRGQLGDGGNNAEQRSCAGLVKNPSGSEALTGVVGVSAGWHHSLALTAEGEVLAWGDNAEGQLGDGTFEQRPLPVTARIAFGDPRQPLNGVKAIAAGAGHSAALLVNGDVWSWGLNCFGQLGDDSTETTGIASISRNPVLRGVHSIALGGYHTVAMDAEGCLWAWGNNARGQLGDRSHIDRHGPQRVIWHAGRTVAGGGYHTLMRRGDVVLAWGSNESGQLGRGAVGGWDGAASVVCLGAGGRLPLANVVSVAAGGYHSLALLSNGRVWTWGEGGQGQLGQGTRASSASPVAVLTEEEGHPPLSGVIAIAAGWLHSAALCSDGTVWCWGANGDGQLGNGSTDATSSYAVHVTTGFFPFWPLEDVIAIAAGDNHTLAVAEDGTVWSWGDNEFGQLGDGGAPTDRTTPVQVTRITHAAAVAGGWRHSLCADAAGTIWVWGDNAYGQRGVEGSGAEPLALGTVYGAADIAAGDTHSTAVLRSGEVWSWGGDEYGQLGNGSAAAQPTPCRVRGAEGDWLTGIVAVAAGARHSLAVRTDRTICGWGDNGVAQLTGTDSVHERAVPLGSAARVVAVAGGTDFSAALKSDGTVWCWGRNDSGQLGDGTRDQRTLPVCVRSSETGDAPLRGIIAIDLADGGDNAYALRVDGTVWAWGTNTFGQLGIGRQSYNEVTAQPVVASGGAGALTEIVAISAGESHAIALDVDGTVWNWGYSTHDEVCGCSSETCPTPTQVTTDEGRLASVRSISAGGYHSLAVRSDGTVWGWGYNLNGQAGDWSSSADVLHATRIPDPTGIGALQDVVAVAAGRMHSLAVVADGRVWAWGRNGDGELGICNLVSGGLPDPVHSGDCRSELSGIVGVSCGLWYSLALDDTGVLWMWGDNEYGQLGVSSTGDVTRPRQVSIPSAGHVTDADGGMDHTLVLTEGGGICTAGDNTFGQFGDGSAGARNQAFFTCGLFP